MATTPDYQVNFPSRPKQASLRWDPRAPMYASADGRAASLSSEECVFLPHGSSEPHVMTVQVLHALDLCREFRTLDEHAARIESTLSDLAGKRDEIQRVLDSLVQRKLLVRDADFIARFNAVRAIDPIPLRAVFIRACDRPDRFSDLLASLVDYEQRHRANRRYVVVDDSVSAAHSDKHRDSLRNFARATGCKVSYVGRSESAKFVDRLSKANRSARDAVRAALLREAHPREQRFGGGRSRNLITLLSAGARLILLDDDLRLPLRRPGFARSGFDPNPASSARARFFSGMEEALDCGTEIDEDPFELHLRACGQSLGACLTGENGLSKEALRGLNLGQLYLLDPDARVVTSHHGSYGSSRSESTFWLYQLGDAIDREEFWHERERYERNVAAHFVLYGAARARVLEVPGFTPFTLDNSMLLPCTNPVGRAEDSLASALTRYCHPDSVALELPVAVGHVQESLRKRFAITHSVSPPRVNDFLREFVRRQFGLFKAEDAGQRMRLLAQVMRDLAGASVKDRVEYLREYRSHVHADVIERMQRQLETNTEAPVYWQADVRAIVQANAKALLDSEAAPRLAEWPQDIDAAGCAKALAEELDSMAQICEHWPAMWQYASEHSEKFLSSL
ncbi:MAG: hypothetical protein ABI451_05810 [Dokdonella sp.]